MTSVEALWTAKFGTAEYSIAESEGGVAIIETGKVYGGDSIYAYRGDISVNGSAVDGNLTMYRHNWSEGTQSCYGTQEASFTSHFVGSRQGDDVISGKLLRNGYPDGFFQLTRLQNLD